MSNIPFTSLNFLHKNYTYFVSSNDNKFDIIDANVTEK